VRRDGATILFSATAFGGAFLLFQVQPLVGKAILPWFGGSAAVWTTCLLFFQIVLFAGYAAAHLSASRLPARAQLVLHLALLSAGLAYLPILPDAAWKDHDPNRPGPHILALLAASVGPTLLVVSMTGPALQTWFARLRPGVSPYPLYAMSNAGSLLGLLSYPFLVEPALGVEKQSLAWSAGYVLFATCCGATAWWALAPPDAAADTKPALRAPLRPAELVLWTALAACGSMLLLALTNQICLNVASVPFLWVLPLGLYLLSFIVTFGGPRGYPRTAALLATVPAVAAVVLLMRGKLDVPGLGRIAPTLPWVVGLYCLALFVLCLVCHGELHRRRPPVGRLTAFYLSIAAGGAVGGVAIGAVAPRLLLLHQELQASLLAFSVVVLACLYRDPESGLARGRPRWVWACLVGWVVLLAVFFWQRSAQMLDGAIWYDRNFYGTTRVLQAGPRRLLIHGTTRHGFQDVTPLEQRQVPTGYYAPGSGIGATLGWLAATHDGPLRVGVIGLGAGTLAAYCRPGDAYRFYDIDPAVLRAAEEWFSYLADARARGCDVSVVAGDARLSLERELAAGERSGLDVMVLDAFSSDAIPVHLLTGEAFAIYREHLAPAGLLALHVTNSYLDLARVAFALAAADGLEALHLPRAAAGAGEEKSDWVLIGPAGRLPSGPAFLGARRSVFHEPRHAWSDDFSNLLSVLK
jgi:hypothetical protein